MKKSIPQGTLKSLRFSGEVRDLSGYGTGVVHHPDGRVVFVPGVWPGDAGEFEIVRAEKRYALGRLVRLTEMSSRRVSPGCSHHGVAPESCGGCPWMMAEYSSQIFFKEKFLKSLFERSGLDSVGLRPLIAAPESYGYRNRAQFKSDGERLGYVSPLTHQIIDIKECPILTLKNQSTLAELRGSLPNPAWRPKAEENWVSLNINEEVNASEVAPGKELGFLQGNSVQNERMRGWVKEHLSDEHKGAKVLELFCGSGNFTEVLSELGFEKILAAESSEDALGKLATKNLRGVQTLGLNLYKAASLDKIKIQMPAPDVLLLDPPRTGFKGLANVARKFRSLKSIYYISCDPITFVRDAKPLIELRANLKEVTPIDLFPHTPHIELMAKFEIS